MANTWTMGKKIGMGFAATAVLTLVIGAIAVYSLRNVVAAKDKVISVNSQNLVDAQILEADLEAIGGDFRGALLTGDAANLAKMAAARATFRKVLARTKSHIYSSESKALVEKIETLANAYDAATDVVAEQITNGASAVNRTEILERYKKTVLPLRISLDATIDEFIEKETALMDTEREAATKEADTTVIELVILVVVGLVLAMVLGYWITAGLTKQVADAVSNIRSSSAELQAAANQQATGSSEQAAATNEVTATIKELLSTSRQIAESSRQVSQIAEETAGAAKNGGRAVQGAQETNETIKRQVDLIVTHMLDLGRKSQQIGGILEIINELAEQTNILSINATIEAAGAGEHGRRFAVVADEIRKLADRVGGSTKEIRVLIDDIRGAANATVMTTEDGAKAVAAGIQRFTEVSTNFQQIASRIEVTTEAAREIELSTKQQTTAVEQVNLAITNIAQAATEMEASSRQTLQTSAQLAGLSKGLLRLVQTGESA